MAGKRTLGIIVHNAVNCKGGKTDILIAYSCFIELYWILGCSRWLLLDVGSFILTITYEGQEPRSIY